MDKLPNQARLGLAQEVATLLSKCGKKLTHIDFSSFSNLKDSGEGKIILDSITTESAKPVLLLELKCCNNASWWKSADNYLNLHQSLIGKQKKLEILDLRFNGLLQV